MTKCKRCKRPYKLNYSELTKKTYLQRTCSCDLTLPLNIKPLDHAFKKLDSWIAKGLLNADFSRRKKFKSLPKN